MLSKVGSYRDGFLVIGAAIYGSGLAVWSYHAWKNGIGLLPALDMQYFIAGVVPFCLFAFLFFFIKEGRAVINKVKDSLSPGCIGWYLFARRFIVTSAVIGFGIIFAYWIAQWFVEPEDFREYRGYVEILLVIFTLSIIFLPPLTSKKTYMARPLKVFQEGLADRGFTYYFAVSIFLLGLSWFLNSGYPKLPQELGGFLPKNAVLFVKSDTFPIEINSSLLSQAQS
jgi:hypothetical protein